MHEHPQNQTTAVWRVQLGPTCKRISKLGLLTIYIPSLKDGEGHKPSSDYPAAPYYLLLQLCLNCRGLWERVEYIGQKRRREGSPSYVQLWRTLIPVCKASWGRVPT